MSISSTTALQSKNTKIQKEEGLYICKNKRYNTNKLSIIFAYYLTRNISFYSLYGSFLIVFFYD